jgi:putative membrane protein
MGLLLDQPRLGNVTEGSEEKRVEKPLVKDVVAGLVAGTVGTMVMERVSMALYEYESEEDKKREEELREAMPTVVMVQKLNEQAELGLSDERVQKLGEWAHFGFGVGWGPVYAALERRTQLHPVVLGSLLGTGVWVLFDEGFVPLVKLSPPNKEFPLSTHVRAFLNHLVFGLTIAGVTAVLRGRGTGRG